MEEEGVVMKPNENLEVVLRQRMSQHDAHYGGDLVDGARILGLFGDAATELLIRHDGDEGLFRAYERVDFLAPVYAGDYVEIRAKIIKVGNTSRKMSFEAYKVVRTLRDPKQPSAADVLAQPEIVVKAMGTCVVPKECQR
jgi:3-aminobutyryl-CoA ammonia-lyase